MPVPSLQQLAVQKVPRRDLRRLLQSADVLPESLVALVRQALTTLRQWKARFRPRRLSVKKVFASRVIDAYRGVRTEDSSWTARR